MASFKSKGVVRQSLFRHILLTAPSSPDAYYSELDPREAVASDTNLIAAGLDGVLAYVESAAGGSGVGVVPVNALGRAGKGRRPVVRVGGEVTGLAWNPFVPGQLATASSDGSVKLWDLPTDAPLSVDVMENVGLYRSGSGSAQRGVLFHPSASSILLSRGVRSMQVWDITRPDVPGLPLEHHKWSADLCHMCWSYMGDTIATTDKSKQLRLFDPRLPAGEGGEALVASVSDVHSGSGTTRVAWCNSSPCFITTGTDKMHTRELALWDSRALSHGPTSRERLSGSSSTGALLPIVDYGTNLVFLCGTGDSSIRVHEFTAGGLTHTHTEGQQDRAGALGVLGGGAQAAGQETHLGGGGGAEVHSICNAAVGGGLAKGYASLPREDCDMMGCEVARLFKLVSGGIQPVRVEVPRRDKRGFHADLYPACPGRYPSLTGDDWLYGGQTLGPYMVEASVKPSKPAINPSTAVAVKGAADGSGNAAAAAAVAVGTTGAAVATLAAGAATAEEEEEDEDGSAAAAAADSPLGDVAADGPSSRTVEDEKGSESAPQSVTSVTSVTTVTSVTEASSSPPVPLGGARQEEDDAPPPPAAPSESSRNPPTPLKQPPRSRFKHVYGKGVPAQQSSFNLKPLLTSLESPILACSSAYWAVPWVGGGGPVFVCPLQGEGSQGKVEPDCFLVNGHRGPVHSIAFSPFDASIMATGSEDHTIKLWRLPEGGALTSHMSASDATLDIRGHDTAVKHVLFHPTAKDLLYTAGADYSIRIFDLASADPSVPVQTIATHPDAVHSMALSRHGSLLATSCRDGHIRCFDTTSCVSSSSSSSSGEETVAVEDDGEGRGCVCECAMVSSGVGHEGSGTKAQQVTFWHHPSAAASGGAATGGEGGELLVTTGFGKASDRQVRVWSPRDLSAPLCSIVVDYSSGILFPTVAESSGLLVVAGRGDLSLKVFEIITPHQPDITETTTAATAAVGDTAAVSVSFCSEFKGVGSSDGMCGVVMAPQRCQGCLAVEQVELARLLRLSQQTVEPITFWLPRSKALKEFFQDDVYGPVRQNKPACTSEEWLAYNQQGQETRVPFPVPAYISLCPEGMPLLSSRVMEGSEGGAGSGKPSKVAQFRAEIDERERLEAQRQDEFTRLSRLANENATFHPNRSTAGAAAGPGIRAVAVDCAPILDSDEEWSD